MAQEMTRASNKNLVNFKIKGTVVFLIIVRANQKSGKLQKVIPV